MCLIIAKPKGLPLPSRKRLKKWFAQYSDGFGISFQYEGRVKILKGAMTPQEMFALVSETKLELIEHGLDVKDVDVVIQYRQAYTGSVSPEYCHPFPVTSSQEELDSIDVVTDCALAHNGVIWEYNDKWTRGSRDINDAQEFIKDYLVDFGEALYNPAVQKLIEEYTLSKFALLTADKIHYIGEFIKDGGYLFSNLGYMGISYEYYSTPAKSIVKKAWWDEDYYGGSTGHTNLHGIVCDGCGEFKTVVYDLPTYGGLGCYDCYEYLEGLKPGYAERHF